MFWGSIGRGHAALFINHTRTLLCKQLAMLREAGMYAQWMPFMSQSQVLSEANKTELVFHSTVSVPWIATRFVHMLVVGADCVYA